MPSWMMTVTDPVGDSWYRGQVSLGAEVVYIQFQEPFSRTASASPRKSNTPLSHLTGFAPMPNSPEALSGPISPEKFRKSPASSISS